VPILLTEYNSGLELWSSWSGALAIESKHQTDTPHDEMLCGWKDIANYMGKGVRTVQRYERDLGLPVRRLSGQKIGAVIATKSDLDSWVRSSATAQELINRSQKAINAAQESRNVAQDVRNVSQDVRNVSQDSLNVSQDSLNVSQDSRNVSQDSLNVSQDSLNKEARSVADHLVSEIAKGLQDRTDLQAQMTELRKELRISVSKIRENLLKLRRQVNEMRRRQDFMVSVIKDYSKVRALLSNGSKRQKPN
jgi:hypothetical protein